MAHVFVSMNSVVDSSPRGHAVVLRDFRENGSKFGGKHEIAQSRRSDADLSFEECLGQCLDDAGFFEPSRN